ncbi:thermonuclease family protein [Candidatus Pelagibacter sp.]|nr:thermonuclease family protein [Candidatus Pelagibacter sp.]
MFFTKRKILILIIICLITFIFTYNDVKSSETSEVIGQAHVIDADTIKINSVKIRLHGIDAPEKKQICKKPYFTLFFISISKSYSCGDVSTNALTKKINKEKISCKIIDKDFFNRSIGVCFKGNLNLNSWLVSNGYAVAYRKYSKDYISEELDAKENKKGLWQGKFEMPWDYRKSKKN